MPRWRSTAAISVYRAAQLVLERVDRPIDLSITLTKRIPLGPDWGRQQDAGGDHPGPCPTVGVGLSVQQMAEVGQQLGSDVPFFVAPAACVTGRVKWFVRYRLPGSGGSCWLTRDFGRNEMAYQQPRGHSPRCGHFPTVAAVGEPSTLDWAEIIPLVENDFEVPALLNIRCWVR